MYGFISRNLKHGLVYAGKPESLDQMCEPEEAQKRYASLAKQYPSKMRKEVELVVYGKKVSFPLPIVEFTKKPDLIDVTNEVYDYIIKQAKAKRISDNILGIWQELIKGVGFYKVNDSIENIVLIGYIESEDDGKKKNLKKIKKITKKIRTNENKQTYKKYLKKA